MAVALDVGPSPVVTAMPHTGSVTIAAERSAQPLVAAGFRSITGRGVEARIEGIDVAVGVRLSSMNGGWQNPTASRRAPMNGASVLHVVRDGAVIGAIAL